MSKYRFIVMALGGILGLFTVEASADPGADYCRGYANAAVNQARAARSIPQCAHFIRDLPARWSLNYDDHFRACLPLFGSGQNASEERARAADLNQCIHQMSSPAAQVGDIAYCLVYADDAVIQSQAVRAFDRCAHFIRDLPTRWSLHYDDHFHACLSAFGSAQNSLEERARTADLNQCIHQMSLPPAQGGDIDYCLRYASDAVNQSQAARAFDQCNHFIRELPARWSLNYDDHFHACLPLFGSGRNAAEREGRIADLNQCIHQMSSPTAAEPPQPTAVVPPPGK